jgi:hypothetical protein
MKPEWQMGKSSNGCLVFCAAAELLNRDFISIKLDRAERPDIDQSNSGLPSNP